MRAVRFNCDKETQRHREFHAQVIKIQDPKSSDSLTLCFNFPQILKSAESELIWPFVLCKKLPGEVL